MATTENGMHIEPKGQLTQAASGVRIYDTAHHKVMDFRPVTPGKVTMYVCGATVQASPHVGHVRAGISFDVIRRWFMKLGYEVTFVRNVTDIDDKILDKAAADGQNWWARAYYYEQEFSQAYRVLGVLTPTYEPRATGHVTDMVDLVQRLIDRGHAYLIPNPDGSPSGNVYFDVPSWPHYGELTHQQAGTQATGDESARIADAMGPSVDAAGEDKYNPADEADLSEEKHDPRDFALWKASKDSDPLTARWRTPFGTGRPGWHLECSAMSHRYLGDEFDIHGGGLDLRFPHHENEMAQSRAAGWGFAHYWMHSAWVTQKGEKMSKSLGNGLSIPVVLSQCTPWMVRYALATVQYRSMLEWSQQTIAEAQSAYSRISNFLDHAGAAVGQPSRQEVTSYPADQLPQDFIAAMNDDLNVSTALAAVFSSIRYGNTTMNDLATLPEGPERNQAITLLKESLLLVRAMLDVFGLDPLDPQWLPGGDGFPAQAEDSAQADKTSGASSSQTSKVLDSLIRSQLDQRQAARKAKDFARADAIRDSLAAAGISIEDGPQGSSWKFQES